MFLGLSHKRRQIQRLAQRKRGSNAARHVWVNGAWSSTTGTAVGCAALARTRCLSPVQGGSLHYSSVRSNPMYALGVDHTNTVVTLSLKATAAKIRSVTVRSCSAVLTEELNGCSADDLRVGVLVFANAGQRVTMHDGGNRCAGELQGQQYLGYTTLPARRQGPCRLLLTSSQRQRH